jgi:hypothetical protein
MGATLIVTGRTKLYREVARRSFTAPRAVAKTVFYVGWPVSSDSMRSLVIARNMNVFAFPLNTHHEKFLPTKGKLETSQKGTGGGRGKTSSRSGCKALRAAPLGEL